MEEDTYTPAEAARILRLSKRRVIQLIDAGDLSSHAGDHSAAAFNPRARARKGSRRIGGK